MKHNTLITLLLLIPWITKSQVAELSIANLYQDGSDVYFDIYLRQSHASSGPIYLGNADFILDFDNGNFSQPSVSIVTDGDPVGYCSFVPTISNVTNDLFTRDGYYTGTATSISGSRIRINLNGPSPQTQSVFDTRVARIDGTGLTHRLGRYKISGSNQTGNLNLTWHIASNGLSTKVFSFSDTEPFTSSEISISAINPQDLVLPFEMLKFSGFERAYEIVLDWTTLSESDSKGFEVQKKDENDHWTAIDFVRSRGNTTVETSYRLTDPSPMIGENYYRIKQIDNNGNFTFSTIIMIPYSPSRSVSIYPNPSSSFIYLDAPNGKKYYITDANGRQMLDGIVTDDRIVISAIPAGTYFVKIDDTVNKFIKW